MRPGLPGSVHIFFARLILFYFFCPAPQVPRLSSTTPMLRAMVKFACVVVTFSWGISSMERKPMFVQHIQRELFGSDELHCRRPSTTADICIPETLAVLTARASSTSLVCISGEFNLNTVEFRRLVKVASRSLSSQLVEKTLHPCPSRTFDQQI